MQKLSQKSFKFHLRKLLSRSTWLSLVVLLQAGTVEGQKIWGGAYVLYQYLQNLDGTGLASLSGAKSGGTHAPFAPPRPQFRRHCTSQSMAAAADLKPASRELGGAIAFFRALFGCFVLNFSSHFLLLTPPGKKTTTGDTTSSLKNYVQNKSYYQCFAYFVFSERKVQCCLWISVLVHLAKIKICTAKKLVKLQQLLFCAPQLFMCQVNKPKLYQNFKREKLEILFECYFVFWFLKTDWSDWVSVLVSVMQWFKQLSKSTCKLRL